MTKQLARRPFTQLRDDHVETNPVTTLEERFVLLTHPHGWTFNQVDQLLSGGGGALSPMWNKQFATLASGETDPLGGSTALLLTSLQQAYAVAFTESGYWNGGYRNWPGPVTGDLANFYVIVKAGTSNYCSVIFANNSEYGFDLTTGARTFGPTDGKVKTKSLGNGWWMIYSVGLTLPASFDASQMIKVYVANATQGQALTPAAGQSIRIWLAQGCHLSAQATLPPGGGTSGLDNAGDGKFPFYNPLSDGGEIVSIPLPASAQAPAALTVYMEWLDRGNQLAASPPGVFRLGNLANTGNGINVTQTPTGFSGTYTNGGSTSTATVALTTVFGDLVTLRATLSAGGALTLAASKNGAAEVVGASGSAAGLAGAWSDSLVVPNCLGSGSANTQGDMALRKLRLYAGEQPLTVCQA